MSVSDYRKKIIERVAQSRSSVERDVSSAMEMAASEERLAELVSSIGDQKTSDEEKTDAINTLNALSNFSSAARKLQPELVNLLRGHIDAPDAGLRLAAISTLASLKDDVVQERLLDDVASDKGEAEQLVPTATAISMLGLDEKALPPSILRKIIAAPPDEDSRTQAIRQMPSDPESVVELIDLMQNDAVPLVTRTMIPEMVSEAAPDTFIGVAEEMLRSSGSKGELAPFLVRGIAKAARNDATAATAATSAKDLVKKMRADASEPFEQAARVLLDEEEANGE